MTIRPVGSSDPPRKQRAEDLVVPFDAPGSMPGTLSVDPDAPPPVMDVIAFGPDEMRADPIDDVAEVRGYFDGAEVTWLNIDGVGDARTIERAGEIFGIHRLTLEDVVHVRQRAKVEAFPSYIFIVSRMVYYEEGQLETEQLGLLLGDRWLVTFQEGRPGDCLAPVRQRLEAGLGRLRSSGPDYLAYALVDAVTDHFFPVVAAFGEQLEQLEDEVISESPPEDIIHRIHDVKRQLLTLRRTIAPQRDLVAQLIRDPNPLVGETTRLYLRDVSDHTVQIIELLDSYREVANGLVDLHLGLASNRMNEAMKVLTVIGALFMPLTFIAGVYGMNFDPDASPWNMPELRHPFGYPAVLWVMLLTVAGMLLFFRRRGWLGGRRQ